jgi:hypothetical protein
MSKTKQSLRIFASRWTNAIAIFGEGSLQSSCEIRETRIQEKNRRSLTEVQNSTLRDIARLICGKQGRLGLMKSRRRKFCSVVLLAVASSLFQALAQTNSSIAEGGNNHGYDMARETTFEMVNAAVAQIPTKLPPGPFQPTLAEGQAPAGKIVTVTMLGSDGKLDFKQDAAGLKVKLPVTPPCQFAYVLKITGLKMNPPTWTASRNSLPDNGVASSEN